MVEQSQTYIYQLGIELSRHICRLSAEQGSENLHY